MEIIETKYGLCIHPYKKRQLRNLERENSEYDPVYHKEKDISGFIVPYNDKENAYLTYYRNMTSLKDWYDIIPMKIGKIKRMQGYFALKDGESLTEIQTDLIQQIIGGKEYDHLSNNQWYMNLQTGYGKTLTSLYFASLIRYRTLVICFSRKILTQWGEKLEDKFDMDDGTAMSIDTGDELCAIMDGRIDISKTNIFFCTSNLLDGYGKKHGYASLETLCNRMGIGLLIIDEAHRAFGKTIRISAVTNIKYTLFLSADYAQGNCRNEGKFLQAFSKASLIKPQTEVQDMMKYTIGITIKYNTHPTGIEKEAPFTKYGYNADLYMQYELKKDVFYEALMYIIKEIYKVNRENYKILILFTNIEPVDVITDYLSKHPILDTKKIGKYYASMDPEAKARIVDNDIIVATYGSFSTGMDITTIRYVIGTNQSNKVEDNQTAGRAGRKFELAKDFPVYYFMMVDAGFAYCKKKLITRLTYLAKMKLKQILNLTYISERDQDYDDLQ